MDIKTLLNPKVCIGGGFNTTLRWPSKFAMVRPMLSCAVFICLVLTATVVHAQQLEDFSLLRENAAALNPAMVGNKGFLAGTATFRDQFSQIANAPYTAYLLMEGQVADKNVGIGGSLIHDQVGPTGKTGATISASYQLKLGKDQAQGEHYNTEMTHMITFGLSVGLMQYRLDGSMLIPDQQGDPLLYTSHAYKLTPDIALGAFYQWKNHLYAGASLRQVMGLDVNYQGQNGQSALKTVRDLDFLLGGKLEVVKHIFSIDPVAAFRWEDRAPPQGDIGTRITFLDAIWVGGTYRSLNTLVLDVGIEIKGTVKLCYAYDYNFSKFGYEIGATHEGTIAFRFNHKSVRDTKFFSGLNK